MKNGLLIIALGLLLTGCGGRAKKPAPAAVPTFPSIEIPTTIAAPRARAEHYIEHYWDRFDFADTLFLAHRDVLEQALVDYLYALNSADTTLSHRSIFRMMVSAQADTAMYRFFREKTEHYLWESTSPYRNGELYLPVLEAILASEKTDPSVLLRAKHQYEQSLRNRPGHRATDFSYTLASGRTDKLSRLRSEYTLLFFNNPECSACAQIMAYTAASPVLAAFQREGRLAVLAVYTDEDLEKWRSYLPEMPAGWIVSYNPGQTIADQNLYDLKAIPSLYLLDRDKTVLLRDADIQWIEAYLQQVLQRESQ